MPCTLHVALNDKPSVLDLRIIEITLNGVFRLYSNVEVVSENYLAAIYTLQ